MQKILLAAVIGGIVLAFCFLAVPRVVSAPKVQAAVATSSVPVVTKQVGSKAYDPVVMAAVAMEFGQDAPIMLKVAECESKYRQYNNDGTVFRGKVNTKDVGVFQVNEFYHRKVSLAAGFDIHTLKGNIAYARHLYDAQGIVPWTASKGCWDG